MIQLKNISVRVGSKLLLDDISADFTPSKLHLIIGPNGAGKSTLIKAICNQVNCFKGTIEYGNNNLKTASFAEMARVRAVLSQNIELAFPMLVDDVVMMGRYPHFKGKPTNKDIEACHASMEYFNIMTLSKRNYLTLSGGEKQRVQFARVLSQIWYPVDNCRRYLILDEPLTFLDVYYQFQLMNKIKTFAMQEDVVVIGVIHDLNLVSKYADRILLLNNGKVLANGTPEQVFTVENVQAAYCLAPIIRNENGCLSLFFE